MKQTWKQAWQRLSTRFDALSLRERVLIAVMVNVVLAAAINAALLEPLARQDKKLAQTLSQQQSQGAALDAQLAAARDTLRGDPDAAARARLALLNRELAEIEVSLGDVQKKLVAPDNMARLLEDILNRNRQLRLVSLRTLPLAPLVESKEPAPAPPQAGAASQPAEAEHVVYKHGVEITLDGTYADLLRYLTELEGLPWRMYWAAADFRVEQYPQARLVLVVYTLSLDKTWLSV
jgi:MSHA biogenesis protein MshJ